MHRETERDTERDTERAKRIQKEITFLALDSKLLWCKRYHRVRFITGAVTSSEAGEENTSEMPAECCRFGRVWWSCKERAQAPHTPFSQ